VQAKTKQQREEGRNPFSWRDQSLRNGAESGWEPLEMRMGMPSPLGPYVAEQLHMAALQTKLHLNAKLEAFSILSGRIKFLYPSMPAKFCSQRTRKRK